MDKMKYVEIVERIKELDGEIARISYLRREKETELQLLNQEYTCHHRQKWELEKLIVPILKVPTCKPSESKPRKNPEDIEIDIDKMSEKDITRVLAALRARQRGED